MPVQRQSPGPTCLMHEWAFFCASGGNSPIERIPTHRPTRRPPDVAVCAVCAWAGLSRFFDQVMVFSIGDHTVEFSLSCRAIYQPGMADKQPGGSPRSLVAIRLWPLCPVIVIRGPLPQLAQDLPPVVAAASDEIGYRQWRSISTVALG
jgi:hypothetical protein